MANRDFLHVYVMTGLFVLVLCGLGGFFIVQAVLDDWSGGKGGSSWTSDRSAGDPYQLLAAAATRKIDKDPDDPAGYLERAELHLRFGYQEKAIDDYTAAIERGEDSPSVYNGRAQALQSLDRLEEAVEDFSRGVERSPFDESAIWNRAKLRQHLGQWEISVEELQAALDRTESRLLYQELGWAQWGLGDYDGALESFSRVIELGGMGVHPLMARGMTLAYLGHLPEAQADLEEAVSMRQQGADYAHFMLWLVRARQGDREDGDVTLAAFFDSGDTRILGPWPVMIAEFLLGRITEEELLAVAEKSKYLKPGEQVCEASYYAGMVRLIDGDEPAAINHFRRVIDTEVRNYYEYYGAMAELRRLDGEVALQTD
jgi:lipoprotein NlpI